MHHGVKAAAVAQQLHRENDRADAEHHPGEDLRELRQLDLERRLPLRGVGQRVRDLAHLGVHAGGRHDKAAAAVDHRAAHVDHVLAVAERHFRAVAQVNDVDELVHRHALTGQRRLLNLEAGTLEEASVRRNGIARFQQHHVADNQVFALDLHDLAVTQNLGGRCAHLLECFDRLFRLALLVNAEHSVNNDDKQDDENIGGRLALVDRGHGADGGGSQQNEDHRVRHLHEEPLDERILFGCLQFVFAVRFKALLRLGGGKPPLGGGDLVQHGVFLVCVEFHLRLLLS